MICTIFNFNELQMEFLMNKIGIGRNNTIFHHKVITKFFIIKKIVSSYQSLSYRIGVLFSLYGSEEKLAFFKINRFKSINKIKPFLITYWKCKFEFFSELFNNKDSRLCLNKK